MQRVKRTDRFGDVRTERTKFQREEGKVTVVYLSELYNKEKGWFYSSLNPIQMVFSNYTKQSLPACIEIHVNCDIESALQQRHTFRVFILW